MGTSKRSIKPKFSLSLWNAFIESPEVVCSSPWLVDIVVDIINTSMNVKDMDFIVDYPLAEVFNEIAPGSRDHYREYNGETEIYAQVYMFDMLSRMDESNNIQANFVKLIREKLFKPWTQNFPGMPIYVAWKKPSYLQTLVLLERFVLESEAPGFLDLIITKVLSYEPHPRYRFLLEWIMVLCILRFPENRDCIWKHLRFPENQNPKLMASLLRVGLMVARELDTSIREEFFTELVHVDVPLASSTKAIIRHQAIAMLLELWDDAVTFGFESLTSNSFFSRVYQGVIHSPYYKEYSGAKSFRTFDAKKNYSLSGIFGGGYLIGGDPVELIQAHYFTELPETPQRLISIGASSLIEIEQSQNSKVSFSRQDAEALTEALTAPLQTKAQSWDPSTLLNPPKKPSSVTSIPEPTSSDLILMASLIENPLNLGGISRVSECLGVRELVVGSKALTKTSEFSSTSVHSEAWLSITEVPVAEITAYLREKRSQGYTVVGVEQTDRSEILGHGWACPKRCVLVLGTEKFGIPADLLVELDSCVEIPQTGVTRSMNVQTAAGVVLYECFRQGNAEK
ncbi:hypothetical protein EDC01DRAFT_7245 [Geopyxis carbonaria]|nr:hypothetical protein EDC01DRAFT_7245 [Geopyxis carbonaria]